MIGIAVAKANAFFPSGGSGGKITPRDGILRAAFRGRALLRCAAGGETALQALLIGTGFLRQTRQIKTLRPGNGWGTGQH
jgi:hypothetical protein